MRRCLSRHAALLGIAFFASAIAVSHADCQESDKPLRDRLIECGAQITELTVTDGFAILLGAKPTSSTTLTEIQFRILPNPIEYLPDLQIIIANGPPLRNRSRESLTAYPFSDAELIAGGKLGTVRSLEIPMTLITDRGLKEYAAFDKLETLDLSHNKVTDAGIASLKAATALKELRIDMTEATDSCIEAITELKSLELLDISGSHITEKILPVLVKLPRLRKVIIHHDQFSDAAKEQLRAKHKVVEVD